MPPIGVLCRRVLLPLLVLLGGCTALQRPRIEKPPAAENAPPVLSSPAQQETAPPMLYRLPNNLTVIHKRVASNSIVAVTCLAQPGATSDPGEKLGRTHLMGRVLSKGTKSRTSDEIAETLEGMGARFGCSDSHDYVAVSLQCVREDLGDAFAVFADVLLHPSFPIEEMRTEKQKVLAAIRVRDDQTPSATMKMFRRALFGPGKYGRPIEGEPATVQYLTQTDLVEAHANIFRPGNMVLSIVGDVSSEEALALANRHFGALPGSETPTAFAFASVPPRSGNEEVVRDVEQGFVAMGTYTCPLGDPDGPALDVAGAILGQGMSARLFRELRDERGLAYMVGAFNTRYRDAGTFGAYIGTSPEAVRAYLDREKIVDPLLEEGTATEMDWAGRALWAEVERLRTEPVPLDELDRAKAYLVGGYLRGHETNASQSHYLAYWHLMGLGIEYDARYPDELRAVTSRDIMRVANKYFVAPSTAITRPLRTGR